jgi:hypothetical protein
MRTGSLVLAVLCFLVLCDVAGLAQSNDLVDAILDQDELTAEFAAYLVLVGADLLDPDASPEEALRSAGERGWIAQTISPGVSVRLGDFAHMLVQAFEIPAGLMYRLAPGPRYAARELAFREMVVGSTTPYRNLSGEEALNIMGAVLDWREESS